MDFVLMMFQTLVALLFVCGLAVIVFRVLLPRLQAAGAHRSMVRVVDRVGLDARKSLYVVEVGGRWLLLGASEAGVHLVSELDAAAAEEAAERLARAREERHGFGSKAGASFADTFARITNKRR